MLKIYNNLDNLYRFVLKQLNLGKTCLKISC